MPSHCGHRLPLGSYCAECREMRASLRGEELPGSDQLDEIEAEMERMEALARFRLSRWPDWAQRGRV